MLMSMGTEGEPQGSRKQNMYSTLSQPSHAHLLLQCSWQPTPCTHPAPGGLLHWPRVYSGAHGLVGSPQVSQHGDRANPAHGEGGTAQSLWLLREGGLHRG